MKKVAWLSRHEMAQEQKEDLFRRLGCEAEIIQVNVTWAASSNAVADRMANRSTWRDLLAEYDVDNDVIAGVFPPAALEVIPNGVPVITPVSKQAPELRQGEGTIPFVHARWASLGDWWK